MYCTNCGQKLNKDDQFCTDCGQKVKKESKKTKLKKSKDKEKNKNKTKFLPDVLIIIGAGMLLGKIYDEVLFDYDYVLAVVGTFLIMFGLDIVIRRYLNRKK